MWVVRVLQVMSLVLAVASVFAVAYVSINFPLSETHSLANKAAGMAYIVFVAPVVLLYFLISLPSTLFLLAKQRRAAYGFTVKPWRAIFRANLFVLFALAGFEVVSLALAFFAPTT